MANYIHLNLVRFLLNFLFITVVSGILHSVYIRMNLVNISISSGVNFECKHENNANDKRKKKTILKSIRVILVDQIVTSSRMS